MVEKTPRAVALAKSAALNPKRPFSSPVLMTVFLTQAIHVSAIMPGKKKKVQKRTSHLIEFELLNIHLLVHLLVE